MTYERTEINENSSAEFARVNKDLFEQAAKALEEAFGLRRKATFEAICGTATAQVVTSANSQEPQLHDQREF